jgi:hypothetical protein
MIINEKLTVRDIEAMVKKEEKKVKIKRKTIDTDFQNTLNNTKEYINKSISLKSPVKVSSNKIIITFQNEEELSKFRNILEENDD